MGFLGISQKELKKRKRPLQQLNFQSAIADLGLVFAQPGTAANQALIGQKQVLAQQIQSEIIKEQQRKQKRARRGGIVGGIGSLVGGAIGTAILPGVGTAIGAGLGSGIGSAAGGDFKLGGAVLSGAQAGLGAGIGAGIGAVATGTTAIPTLSSGQITTGFGFQAVQGGPEGLGGILDAIEGGVLATGRQGTLADTATQAAETGVTQAPGEKQLFPKLSGALGGIGRELASELPNLVDQLQAAQQAGRDDELFNVDLSGAQLTPAQAEQVRGVFERQRGTLELKREQAKNRKLAIDTQKQDQANRIELQKLRAEAAEDRDIAGEKRAVDITKAKEGRAEEQRQTERAEPEIDTKVDVSTGQQFTTTTTLEGATTSVTPIPGAQVSEASKDIPTARVDTGSEILNINTQTGTIISRFTKEVPTAEVPKGEQAAINAAFSRAKQLTPGAGKLFFNEETGQIDFKVASAADRQKLLASFIKSALGDIASGAIRIERLANAFRENGFIVAEGKIWKVDDDGINATVITLNEAVVELE